jgi:hypothetical protein
MNSLQTFHENDDRFYIKDSTIIGAGKGLFARKKILQDDKIMIKGVLVEKDSYADQCTRFSNSYKFAASLTVLPNGDIDTGNFLIIPLGFSAIVNHIEEETKRNVQITYLGNYEVAYVFLRDVEKDEEILGNYGDDWQKMLSWSEQHNNKNKENKELWEKFLDLNLYDLGGLR